NSSARIGEVGSAFRATVVRVATAASVADLVAGVPVGVAVVGVPRPISRARHAGWSGSDIVAGGKAAHKAAAITHDAVINSLRVGALYQIDGTQGGQFHVDVFGLRQAIGRVEVLFVLHDKVGDGIGPAEPRLNPVKM